MPPRVTAQNFYDYDKCPHRVYLSLNGDPDKKLPQADFLNLLFEKALLHEAEVVKDLSCVMPEGESLDERFASTLKLMARGAERIYQGVLVQPDDSGIPDLLEKVVGKSAFGDYFYKPVDIKIGSGYQDEQKGKLREDYGLQLFHYGKLLDAVQNAFPPMAEILNKRGSRVPYKLTDFQKAYDELYPDVRALVLGTKTDEPALSPDCHFCQWFGCCEPILMENQDVSLLPGVGRSLKISLNTAGVMKIADVETFDFKANKVKGVAEKRSQSLVQLARVARTGTLEILKKPSLPDPSLKIFFDFEDDPTQELIYLCGILTEPAVGERSFRGLFCADEAGEAQMWREFQAFCVLIEKENYNVFHYGAYEDTKITQLQKRYGTAQASAVDLFTNRMINLFPITRATIVPPTRGYSLKDIAPIAGYRYSVENPGGAQAIMVFQEYQRDQTKADKKQWLLAYNEEDCVALKQVYEWLKAL